MDNQNNNIKIIYGNKELKEIYNEILKEELNKLEKKLKINKLELKKINNMLEEIYQDKVNKIIRHEDFEKFYSKKIEKKTKI